MSFRCDFLTKRVAVIIDSKVIKKYTKIHLGEEKKANGTMELIQFLAPDLFAK